MNFTIILMPPINLIIMNNYGKKKKNNSIFILYEGWNEILPRLLQRGVVLSAAGEIYLAAWNGATVGKKK